ncbi:MAG: hypothetical protein HXY20_11245 [Acidobacteria bacterium]|nr:hypothetical protein [Acidobacteriota bacterium]
MKTTDRLSRILHKNEGTGPPAARLLDAHAASPTDTRGSVSRPGRMPACCLKHPGSLALVLTAALTCSVRLAGTGGKPPVEQGEFSILWDGKEIGSETYVIQDSTDSCVSTSILDFHNPTESRQKVRMETRLEMGRNYVPRAYLLKSDVDGTRGTMTGSFAPNQAMFQYVGGGKPQKRGLLVGNKYTVLDSNIYHHFIFLARLFERGGGEKAQEFEVVIPQEMESGALRMRPLRRETLAVRGKKREVRVLQLDTGALEIHLWVDRDGLLQRISVPARALEILRR